MDCPMDPVISSPSSPHSITQGGPDNAVAWLLRKRRISREKSERLRQEDARKAELQSARVAFKDSKRGSPEVLQRLLTRHAVQTRSSIRIAARGIEQSKSNAKALRSFVIKAEVQVLNAERHKKSLIIELQNMKNTKPAYDQIGLRPETQVLSTEEIEKLPKHTRMWKRLEAEYLERLKLETKVSQMNNIRDRLENEVVKLRKVQDSLDEEFQSWEKATQFFLGPLKNVDHEQSSALEVHLPRPLWQLFTLCRCYLQVTGKNWVAELRRGPLAQNPPEIVDLVNGSSGEEEQEGEEHEMSPVWPVHLTLEQEKTNGPKLFFVYHRLWQVIGCLCESPRDLDLSHLFWDDDSGDPRHVPYSGVGERQTSSPRGARGSLQGDSLGGRSTPEELAGVKYYGWLQSLCGVRRPIFPDHSDVPLDHPQVTMEQVMARLERRLGKADQLGLGLVPGEEEERASASCGSDQPMAD